MSKTLLSILTVVILVFIGALAFIAIENNGAKPAAQNTPTVNHQQTATPPCFVGGCSNEICSDQQGVVSSCIYKAEYSCYKTATCERQTNGQCGWTETVELTSCLYGK